MTGNLDFRNKIESNNQITVKLCMSLAARFAWPNLEHFRRINFHGRQAMLS
jgi:hypothetical protein